MTYEDTTRFTCSPGSEDGPSPCDWPVGTTRDLFGPGLAHASHSASPARGGEPLTSGTCGPCSTASSESADRPSCSVSKSHPQKWSVLTLRLLSLSRFNGVKRPEQTSSRNDSLHTAISTSISDGSMEYKQTWKRRVTPSGTRFWAHTASARRTSDSACGGWPMPTRQDGASSGAAGYSTASGRHSGTTLTDAARFAGWATPAARDWRSESATDEFNEKRWAHPRGKPLSAQAGLAAQTAKRGALNPALSRWLMGYPTAWDECAPMATLSSRKTAQRS